MSYCFSKTLNDSFANTKEKVLHALKEEGFGVLTEIDVQATLKKKIDVDFYRYEILGACNPHFAHQALQAEDKIGVMLPCNVILQQKSLSGPVEVSVVDPISSMQAIQNESLGGIATEVQLKLKKVIDSLN